MLKDARVYAGDNNTKGSNSKSEPQISKNGHNRQNHDTEHSTAGNQQSDSKMKTDTNNVPDRYIPTEDTNSLSTRQQSHDDQTQMKQIEDNGKSNQIKYI